MASIQHPTTGGARRGIGRLLSAPKAAVATSLAGVRRALGPVSTVWLSGLFLVGGLLGGMLLSTQLQTRATNANSASSPITRQSDREMVGATIARLESEQSRVKQQIAGLRAQLNEAQGSDAQRKTTLMDLSDELARQRMGAGMVALQGPGVVATFDDSTAHSIPENEDPVNYIVHEYDLRDVVNALWMAGAEAVSVNGERIVSSSSLYCVGTTILCNVTRLSPPYEVRAIGDPQALAATLQGSTQMEKFLQRAQIYDLPVTVEQRQDVLVPPYNGSFVFEYATVPGEQ
jgi:uncharacterized protein YlxW (UPF0749 family)